MGMRAKIAPMTIAEILSIWMAMETENKTPWQRHLLPNTERWIMELANDIPYTIESESLAGVKYTHKMIGLIAYLRVEYKLLSRCHSIRRVYIGNERDAVIR
jgi:hypothetical protein